MSRHISTYILLHLSEAAYEEIRKKMEEAGYQHAFLDNPEASASPRILMTGITVVPEVEMIGLEENEPR